MDEKKLAHLALKAQSRAYAPYSHFQVGAALACDADGEYSGGITVFPAGMVKGMEYDAVIVWDANGSHYTEADGKLFYVVLTRAMHRLGVLYTGELTALLDENAE